MPEDFENVINAGDRFTKKKEEVTDVVVLDFAELNGHFISEVSAHITSTYGDDYKDPDFDFLERVKNNQYSWAERDKVYVLFGQEVQDSKGNWRVPSVIYNMESGWHQSLEGMRGVWYKISAPF